MSQKRVAITSVAPQLEGGAYFIKRVVDEYITASCIALPDGHDVMQAAVYYKHESAKKWNEVRMYESEQDYWQGTFQVKKQGFYIYKVVGWVDYSLNWQHGIHRKIEDNQHVNSELLEGIEYLQKLKKKADKIETEYLSKLEQYFKTDKDYKKAVKEAVSDKLTAIFKKYPEKLFATESNELEVYVDRKKARFSTWYEFFPRSAARENGKHGTFKDCEALLPRVSKMGFDTLYFPPVHPIGEVNRKGKNNSTEALTDDVGSPWGIGSKLGGHKDIHPELGSLDNFKSLVKKAKKHGIEIAMDFALQCAPDHPYVKSNPDWFKWRPDGTVQYAENPPKKYQDILPIYFETEDHKNLWKELLDIALFWIEECGIQIFRVDNPHTKPYFFWGWMMQEVKKKHPDVLFLAEAFSRPQVMHELARQGYTMSYTYFTWRNSKHELVEYMDELTKTIQKEYFRPNFWPNTPDINPYPLQGANEAQHLIRYVLAATLSSNTGLYGPVYEFMVSDAMPGKEEYLDSEKYQIRQWDWEHENKLTTLITKINEARKNHESLQQTNNIDFCTIENDRLLAYYKYNDDKTNEILIIVNLDSYYSQQGMVQLPLAQIGIHEGQQIVVEDIITGSSYIWDKEWNFVELHPALPFHLFKIKK